MIVPLPQITALTALLPLADNDPEVAKMLLHGYGKALCAWGDISFAITDARQWGTMRARLARPFMAETGGADLEQACRHVINSFGGDDPDRLVTVLVGREDEGRRQAEVPLWLTVAFDIRYGFDLLERHIQSRIQQDHAGAPWTHLTVDQPLTILGRRGSSRPEDPGDGAFLMPCDRQDDHEACFAAWSAAMQDPAAVPAWRAEADRLLPLMVAAGHHARALQSWRQAVETRTIMLTLALENSKPDMTKVNAAAKKVSAARGIPDNATCGGGGLADKLPRWTDSNAVLRRALEYAGVAAHLAAHPASRTLMIQEGEPVFCRAAIDHGRLLVRLDDTHYRLESMDGDAPRVPLQHSCSGATDLETAVAALLPALAEPGETPTP